MLLSIYLDVLILQMYKNFSQLNKLRYNHYDTLAIKKIDLSLQYS